jgi:cytochrome c553
VQPQAGAAPVGTAPAAAQTCVACHGTDGVGITPLYPTLSGQHADYLARTLLDYKNGTRKNAVMATFASQLSEKDIAELAKYYSKQRPSLTVAKHAIWFKAH